MTKKNKVDIYCYVKVSVVGLGMVGPTTSAKIEKQWASTLIKEAPDTWSLIPFEVIEKEEIEEVKNA